MEVSVVLSTYNRPRALLFSALSLSRQSVLPGELVVADDGSGEETAGVVERLQREMPFPVHHARQEDKGFRAARNRNNGVRASSGDYLVFLDGDILASSWFLKAHVERAAEGTFLLGFCAYLDEATSAGLSEEDVSEGKFESISLPDEEARLAKVHSKNRVCAFLSRFGLCKRTKPKLRAGNFSLFRADFESVNGFDENFVGWGQEDDDLGRRLIMARVRPRSVVPWAAAYHLHHPKAREGRWRDGPNVAYFLRKGVSAFCEKGLRKNGPRDIITGTG